MYRFFQDVKVELKLKAKARIKDNGVSESGKFVSRIHQLLTHSLSQKLVKRSTILSHWLPMIIVPKPGSIGDTVQG
jgi:hypothetical protein